MSENVKKEKRDRWRRRKRVKERERERERKRGGSRLFTVFTPRETFRPHNTR